MPTFMPADLYFAKVRVRVGPDSEIEMMTHALHALAVQAGIFTLFRSPDHVEVVIVNAEPEQLWARATALSDLARMLQAREVEVAGARRLEMLK